MNSLDEQIRLGLADPARRDMAARLLVSTYGLRLHARILNLVGEMDADDIFQNTLIKIVQGIGGFDGRSALYSWCYRIASNESLDTLRKRNRAGRTQPLEAGESNHLIADSLSPSADEMQTQILAAIEDLPPQQKLVFEERYFHETPYAELAQRLQKSEGALKANFHHAVQKVSKHLQEHITIYAT